MKKISNLLVLVSLIASGCSLSTPSSLDAVSAASPPSEISSTVEDTIQHEWIPYVESNNPYNVQTAATDEYIFVVDNRTIYRVDRHDGSAKVLIRSQPGEGPQIAGTAGIAVHDGALYYMCVIHSQEALSGLADHLEMSLFRADFDGENITQVADTQNGVNQVYLYDSYLILYSSSPEIDAYRFLKPDAAAETLEEVPASDIGEDRLAMIKRYIRPESEHEQLIKRLDITGEAPDFTAIMANDAYYYLDSPSISRYQLYRLSIDKDDKPIEIPLSDSAMNGLRSHGSFRLVNYDAEWLYLKDDDSLFRIRKDGTEYQPSIPLRPSFTGFIDILDDWVIYKDFDTMYLGKVTGTGEAIALPK
jgi:hypothetical protein